MNIFARRAAFGLPAALILLVLPLGAAAQNANSESALPPSDVSLEVPRAGSSDPSPRSSANALDAFAPIPDDMRLDGIMDEPIWESARVFTGFTQEQPVEGAPAEHDTEVRVVFGDGALW
ncbi:MAG: hypothetical protein WD101_05075, partial [Gemmatimonadota bacterium]